MIALHVIFFIFAALLIGSSVMVITSRNPVRGVLFLVLAFVASAGLWMILQAEFLALALIFVYVGAVLTLFLFVVMMINIDLATIRQKISHYLSWGILTVIALFVMTYYVVNPRRFGLSDDALPMQPANYSNVAQLGQVLYTQYIYAFELAAVVLLVAIIAAISLTFRGKRHRRSQDIARQLAANPKERLRLIKMPVEKR